MKPLILGIALLALTTSAFADEKIISDYSPLSGKGCKETASSEREKNPEIDYFKSECTGIAPYRVFHNGSDERSWLEFKVSNNNAMSLVDDIVMNAPGSFPHIVGKKLEWRSVVENGKKNPFAVIFRVAGQDESNPDPNKWHDVESLMIFKITPSAVCLIGTVPADKPNANEQARKLADDKARAAKCQ